MPKDDPTLLSTEAIESTVLRALRRYGYAPEGEAAQGECVPGAAGMKLKHLRELSGWSASEIAERTGVRLDILTAFEAGESAAARALTQLDLERLASACCGSILDLLGPEHPWARPEPEPRLGGSGCSINPWG